MKKKKAAYLAIIVSNRRPDCWTTNEEACISSPAHPTAETQHVYQLHHWFNTTVRLPWVSVHHLGIHPGSFLTAEWVLVESNQTLLRHPQPPLWASQQRPLLVTFSIIIELQLNSIAQELIFGYRGKQNKHTQEKKETRKTNFKKMAEWFKSTWF